MICKIMNFCAIFYQPEKKIVKFLIYDTEYVFSVIS